MNRRKIHLTQNHRSQSKKEASKMNPLQIKVKTVLNSSGRGINVCQTIVFLTALTVFFAIIS